MVHIKTIPLSRTGTLESSLLLRIGGRQYLLNVTPTTRNELPERATFEQCVPPRSQLLNLMQS